jgi:hypothetical protein
MMFVELLLNLEEGKVLAFFFSPEKEIIVFFFVFGIFRFMNSWLVKAIFFWFLVFFLIMF